MVIAPSRLALRIAAPTRRGKVYNEGKRNTMRTQIGRREFGTMMAGGAVLGAVRGAGAWSAQDAIDVVSLYKRSIVIDALANPGSMNVSWPPRGPLSQKRPLFIPELNHSRRIEGVAAAMTKAGHSATVIEKVIGGNFHRVLKEIWVV
jgi:hypothetical protein